jgi:acyl-coenzyme A thioesterase PaaI-like protein
MGWSVHRFYGSEGRFLGAPRNTVALPAAATRLRDVKPVDLPLNQALGIVEAPAGTPHLLEMPFAEIHRNHLGTMHAVAQFGLAEAASAESLLRRFPNLADGVIPVMRQVAVKYRRPGQGRLLAFATMDEAKANSLADNLARHGRALADVAVTLKDEAGQTTFHGTYTWFISRKGSDHSTA